MLLQRLALRAALACFVLASVPASAETGRASFYGYESGSHRADGRRFVPLQLGAAHRSLRLGTPVRVTDLATGRSVVVPINDRGPAAWTGRIIDLSLGAARALGIVHRGVATVRVDVVD